MLEEPYPLSMISLYNQDFEEVWFYGQDDNSLQSHKNAQVRIDQIWEEQGYNYVQWSRPVEINLDLSVDDDPLKIFREEEGAE